MNQDRIKDILLSIEDPPLEFSVIFSGKKSRKVNGLYKSESREIILHNRNFSGDPNGENQLLYTAIHEYAHHLPACSRGGTLSSKAHTSEFWAIFHSLLEKAENKKIYRNVFGASPELTKLTALIREKYLKENGKLVKELGKYLLRAFELCGEIGGRFEDYVDRILCIPKIAAQMTMKMYQYDLNPSLGADNMRYLAGIRNEDDRDGAEKALLAGKSPDSVKTAVRKGGLAPAEEDPKLSLKKEKLRLEKTIMTLSKRLEEVEAELTRFQNASGGRIPSPGNHKNARQNSL
ncbi:MAG: hypothetical protein LBI67_09250 [Treponema sp.]|jgi:hypothetical protein|nr:hypothetical protein [Treponema sp.]